MQQPCVAIARSASGLAGCLSRPPHPLVECNSWWQERLRLEVLLVSIFLFLSLGGFVARMLDAAAMLGFIA